MNVRRKRVLVVGAGFSGAVVARELADAGFRVLVIDRRSHVAGNAYDEHDDHGFLVHRYGPHIFHTNSERIWSWLCRFTEWRAYEHRVLAMVAGQLLPIPINRTTINRLFKLDLDERGVAAFLNAVREPRDLVCTSEDAVLNCVGRELCDLFFRGYTRKQWGMELSELSASVAARIPTRTNDDDRYFTDKYQGLPRDGYTAMFDRILRDKNIEVLLSTDYFALGEGSSFIHTVYTGPIDRYFDYCFGRLPYRSLRFEHEYIAATDYLQPVATVNYPNDFTYTRVTEFKHMTGQTLPGTVIVREYPQADGEPFYPIPREDNARLFAKYVELAEGQDRTTFVGRLAQYRYYNMDQAVAAALKAAARVISRFS